VDRPGHELLADAGLPRDEQIEVLDVQTFRRTNYLQIPAENVTIGSQLAGIVGDSRLRELSLLRDLVISDSGGSDRLEKAANR
jgi:hypothetical protein